MKTRRLAVGPTPISFPLADLGQRLLLGLDVTAICDEGQTVVVDLEAGVTAGRGDGHGVTLRDGETITFTPEAVSRTGGTLYAVATASGQAVELIAG